MSDDYTSSQIDSLQPGDSIEHPWGELDIIAKRGDKAGQSDTREWYIKDPGTGEELWANPDLLEEIMAAKAVS